MMAAAGVEAATQEVTPAVATGAGGALTEAEAALPEVEAALMEVEAAEREERRATGMELW